MNEDNNNNKNKMPLFPKNVVNFAFFLQIKWNVKGVNKILATKWSFLMQQVSLYLNTKNARKACFKKYYAIGVFQLLQRQICKGNR